MLIHCYGFGLERVEVKTKASNKHLDVRQRAAVFSRQSIIVSCSTAPPESGTDSALADSVMQINSKDNTVCSNLFSSARGALRANVCGVCGCTSEGIGPAACASSPSVGWNILMRSHSICESSATVSKKKKKKRAKNRARTDCLFGDLTMQIDLLPVFIQMVLAWSKRKWGMCPRWTLNTQKRIRSPQMWSSKHSTALGYKYI